MNNLFNFYKNSVMDKLNSVAFDLQLVSFASELQNALNDIIYEHVLQARNYVEKGEYSAANLSIANAICYLAASKHSLDHKHERKEKLGLASAIVIMKLK